MTEKQYPMLPLADVHTVSITGEVVSAHSPDQMHTYLDADRAQRGEPEDEQEPDGVVVGFTDAGKAIVDHDGLEEGWALYTAQQPAIPPGHVVDEMTRIADQYAHRMAMHLECILLDYSGKYWDEAMKTLGDYRAAMNAIHERESPTFMGEPVIDAAQKEQK